MHRDTTEAEYAQHLLEHMHFYASLQLQTWVGCCQDSSSYGLRWLEALQVLLFWIQNK